MPTSYRIDVERRLVVNDGWGVVDGDDLLTQTRIMANDECFDGSFAQVADYREVESFDVSSSEVRELAEFRLFKSGVRRAIVADQDVVFGLARMFQLLRGAEPDEVQVFRTMEEAELWLGLCGEPIAPHPWACGRFGRSD